MKWTEPQYGPSKATKAGKIIAGRKPPTKAMTWDRAFEIATNWRSAHGYPLQVMYVTLRNRSKKVDPKALVSLRLKRIPSVVLKLKKQRSMQLAQMQDLGGCRAVVAKIGQVDELVRVYEDRPCAAALLSEKYDYINNPKPDGYRGVHLVYKYNSRDSRKAQYKGRRIEVQIRSHLQHGWATAVETIDAFTGEAVKSGLGSPKWKRFFLLMGSFIASMEDRPLVPGTPDSVLNWYPELESLINDLNVLDTLEGLHTGLQVLGKAPKHASYNILVLDSRKRKTVAYGFADEESAAEKYSEIEKETINNPSIQAVMVSSESVRAVRLAYPTYYVDAEAFKAIIKGFLDAANERHGKPEQKSPPGSGGDPDST